jgi:Xaa-Pro dipeptidase
MKVSEIQRRLAAAGLDGWLFYDFRRSNPIAYRTLELPDDLVVTRRWYYFLPAAGEPRGLVSALEPSNLDGLPGEKRVYRTWEERRTALEAILPRGGRVAMEYSPLNAIPYVSTVDAGTVELVRSFGVEVVSSADLVQETAARWSDAQRLAHISASEALIAIKDRAFAEASRRLRSDEPLSDFGLQQFMLRLYREAGLVTDGPPIVATNAHCSNPHYMPTPENQTPIQRGDVVMLDFWARLDRPNAVYADHTWMAFAGDRIPARLADVFGIVATARDRAIDFVRDAVDRGQTIQGWQVDDAARGVIVERGYGDFFVHRTGHSIDLEVHGNGANMDNYESHDERTVMAETGFSIEPGIYLPEFGVRSEVNVFIHAHKVVVTGVPIQTEVIPLLGA